MTHPNTKAFRSRSDVGDRAAQMEVRVTNDHGGAERVTVSLMNGDGDRRALGEVNAGECRIRRLTGDGD